MDNAVSAHAPVSRSRQKIIPGGEVAAWRHWLQLGMHKQRWWQKLRLALAHVLSVA